MKPPAMTPDEVAAHPFAPVRVTCQLHGVCLYAGDEPPEGGAAAVAAAAGCPAWTALPAGTREHPPGAYDRCPVPARWAGELADAAGVEAQTVGAVVDASRTAARDQLERDAARLMPPAGATPTADEVAAVFGSPAPSIDDGLGGYQDTSERM